MPTKRILVLANSYKRHARCVAGMEVGAEMLGPAAWLRPVSGESHGELEPRHMWMNVVGPLVPLEIVDVPLIRHAGDELHPEDWVVDTTRKWGRIGKLSARRLEPLEEHPRHLWLESTEHTERVTGDFLAKQVSLHSLFLIRVQEFRVELSHELSTHTNQGKQKTRARFRYRGQEYLMSLTDPAFIARHCFKYPGLGALPAIIRPPYGDRCLLCVSLTPEFFGYHYKVVATVLELP